MHLRSNRRRTQLLLLTSFLCVALAAQQQSQRSPAQTQPPSGVHREGTDNILVDQYGIPLEDQSGKSVAQPAPAQVQNTATTATSSNVGNAANIPPAPNKVQEPITNKAGGYLFRTQVEEVQLHATVIDQRNRLVTGLNKNDFQVYEDGQLQQITMLKQEDVPVSLGILIDNSGSMRDKRAAVNQAAINLVKASNPDDEVFIVNFNDEAYIDQDFTSSVSALQEGLEHIDSRGGTALYDAVIASSDHLARNGRRDKKLLLVVTDGEDNASRVTLEQAVRRVQDDKGPTIYTIGILGNERPKRARRALEALALQTGGIAFLPKDLGDVNQISLNIARDIRSQYLIQYRPTRPQEQGGYRTVRVEARAGGYGKLQVRTRTGYYANQQRAANSSQSATPRE